MNDGNDTREGSFIAGRHHGLHGTMRAEDEDEPGKAGPGDGGGEKERIIDKEEEEEEGRFA